MYVRVHQEGQVLAEFGLGAILVTLAILGGAWIFRAQWERNQCALWTFESAHVRLTGNLTPPRSIVGKPIQVTESADGVQALGRCGAAIETIQLRKLPSIPW